jgi:uncharacterized protein YdaU (DUF1376 family)
MGAAEAIGAAQQPAPRAILGLHRLRGFAPNAAEPPAPRKHRKAKLGPKLPWFKFFAAEFLTDVADFSQAETAGLVRLLAHYWRNGGLPFDNEDEIRRLARMTASQWDGGGRDRLADQFEQPNWRSPDLDERREHAEKVSLKRAEVGEKGGRARAMNRETDDL